MNLIFLDIDGVLNGHDFNVGVAICTIRPECVAHLNRVVLATDAKIVLSSAWRYMIHGGAMTLMGFEYMLRTHGVHCNSRLIGFTCTDETEGASSRGAQIRKWLQGWLNVDRLVVIDDDEFDIRGDDLPLVRTDGAVGMTASDADAAIRILLGTV